MNLNISTYNKDAISVTLNRFSVYYSFKRPIAFRKSGYPAIIEDGIHGSATRKHLKDFFTNQKIHRMPPGEFKGQLNDLFDGEIMDLANKVYTKRMNLQTK